LPSFMPCANFPKWPLFFNFSTVEVKKFSIETQLSLNVDWFLALHLEQFQFGLMSQDTYKRIKRGASQVKLSWIMRSGKEREWRWLFSIDS
jgi:hypothetical protein